MQSAKVFRLIISLIVVSAISIQAVTAEMSVKQRQEHSSSEKIICYFTAQRDPKEIDPKLCTHLMWSFAKINAQFTIEAAIFQEGIYQDAPETQIKKGLELVEEKLRLKKSKPDLKILLSLGGWNYNSTKFQLMVQDDKLRAGFINSTVTFLKRHKFDGLDVYPENPLNRGDVAYRENKSYLLLLFKEMRAALEPFNLILSAAFPANFKSIATSQAAPQVISNMAKYLDFISILAFDLNGDWMNETVHHAPLFTRSSETGKISSVDDVVQDWLKTSIPRHKLILGLSAYGRPFVVKNKKDRCPLTNTPIDGIPQPGDFYVATGPYAYPEICLYVTWDDWDYKWLNVEQVPFAFSNWHSLTFNQKIGQDPDKKPKPLRWVGFDDVRSIDAKVKYLMAKGLGGAALISIDKDDFHDWCRQGKFPLLRVINHHLNKKLLVEYPDANMLFNLTWEESLRQRDQVNFMKNYVPPKDASSNSTIQEKRFCKCKSGVHVLNLDQGSGIKRVQINCDDTELDKIDLIEEPKYDKRDWFGLVGRRFEHRLFFDERVDMFIEQSKPGGNWFSRMWASITSIFG